MFFCIIIQIFGIIKYALIRVGTEVTNSWGVKLVEGLQKAGLNPNEGFNNPEIRKQTQKAMYGPEGNSQGSAAFMTAAGITNLLKNSGVATKGKPFQYFFYLIRDVFMGKDAKSAEKNINKFSNQMEKLTSYYNDWESLKKQVYLAGNGNESKATANSNFRSSVGKFLNRIFGRIGFYFSTDGSPINAQQLTELLDTMNHMSPSQLDKNFPALGESARGVFLSLFKFRAYFAGDIHQGLVPLDITRLWSEAQGGGVAIAGGGHMPDPAAFSQFFNALSEGSSTLSGVSDSNSSKLTYAQNQYNRLFSFVHGMLKAWLNIRKGMNVKMSQARN